MDNWNRLVLRIAHNRGIATPRDARACDVSEATWHRRSTQEGYRRLYRGVKAAPWAPDNRLTDLHAVIAACRDRAVPAGATAMWVEGLGPEPARLTLVTQHGQRIPRFDNRAVRIFRARWFDYDADVRTVDGRDRRLVPETIALSYGAAPRKVVRGALIDLVQHGRTTIDRVMDRVELAGHAPGSSQLVTTLEELGARRPESWFHDDVLTELLVRGYPASPEPLRLDTPDGRGVLLDIPIAPFRVAVEPEGDTYHRGAGPRRADRRRRGQLAGTGWDPVPVDWRDWHGRRPWVFETIDAAILAKFRAGVGTAAQLPQHLRPAG